MILPDRRTTPAHAAELYFMLGLRPIPVYGVRGKSCTCGKDIACQAPGKHPVGADWQHRAPTTIDDVRRVFRHHTGNVGVCVADTPFVFLDFDGDIGRHTLEDLKSRNAVTRTLASRTGGGGFHLLYRLAAHQNPADLSDRRVLPGFDVKKRGQCLEAPSLHVSGRFYEWCVHEPIAVLPDVMFDIIKKPAFVPVARAASSPNDASHYARALRYVSKMPPSIAGSGGHAACFAVARKIVQDFALTDDEAWSVLVDFNARCEPAWSERELRHKLDQAKRARVANPISERGRRA